MNHTNPPADQQLLEQVGGIAFDRQLTLADLLGTQSWNADLDRAEISFTGGPTFSIQVLGTFSHESETWLWAWANAQANLPEAVLRQARELQAYGEAHALNQLRVPQYAATTADLHWLGLVAAGMFGAQGYYLADYGAGTLLVTLAGGPPPAPDDHRLPTAFTQFISQFELRHRPALASYAAAKGFTVEPAEAGGLRLRKGSTAFTAEFDELGRLARLQGQLGGA